MPNVDDHGLEVLKKAARNIGAQPKQDYALQVLPVGDESGGLLTGVKWDWFTVEYPTTTKEIYKFYLNGETGTLQRTIEVNYQDATKEKVISGGTV